MSECEHVWTDYGLSLERCVHCGQTQPEVWVGGSVRETAEFLASPLTPTLFDLPDDD